MFETVTPRARGTDPWRALWAMLIGFFMILVDATIVAVANPAIMASLEAGYDAVIWVTSAYLLAYAVPLLVSGRLGDRYGPKTVYLVGLAVFTAASLWCGLSDTIGMLIAARVVQGMGAALLTPQTMTVITRTFPAARRGVAMSVWGATAGVATLVGPLAGGVLVDHLGWQWIFIVNVPVGILGFALAVWLVPSLPTQRDQRFDLPGVVLSGVGLFLIVFALQEGQTHDWAPWIWATVAVGIAVMAVFIYWQSINTGAPLIPLIIFGERNFSMSNVGVATIGFVVTGMILPLMFYAQAVCGLSPTQAALLTAPMAVATGVLAPFVGRVVDRSHPTAVVGVGFAVMAIGLTWLSIEMTPTTPIWRLVLPLTAMGAAMACIWSPLAATATRNLPPQLAGAGSGVYNTTRQVGSVLGSAGMAAFMTGQLSAKMPGAEGAAPRSEAQVAELPDFLHAPFASAMAQAMLLPASVALVGVVAALFLAGLGEATPQPASSPQAPDEDDDDLYWADGEDEYLEYEVAWDDTDRGTAARRPEPVLHNGNALADTDVLEPVTDALTGGADGRHGPGAATEWGDAEHGPGSESGWRSILDQLLDEPDPSSESIGHAHNGFHVPAGEDTYGLHDPPDAGRRRGDDPDAYGRHSRG